MKRSRTYAILLFLPLLVIGLSGFLSSDQAEHFSKVARNVASELPRQHLSRRTLNDEISRLTLTNYVSALDYDRLYFLASDIASFSSRETTINDELQNGNLDLAGEIFDIFKERVRNRLVFTEKLLEQGFDFTIEESYRWKRKDEPWVANEAEWDDLWRKRIKNEYLRRLIARSFDTNVTAAADSNTHAAPPLPPVADIGETPATESEVPNPGDAAAQAEKTRELNLSPEEFIRDRYTQYLHILEDTDTDGIVQQYLSAFARAFDPHCDYMSPTSTEDFEIEMKLSLVGIGAILRPDDGAARIVSLMPGGPAASDKRENRLQPGDKIIAVAQGDALPVNIIHWPLSRAVRLIRGEIGSRVVLTVIPADPTAGVTKIVDLIRDEVKLEEREAKSRIEVSKDAEGQQRRIGVIILPSFYADMSGRRFGPDYKSSTGDVAAILRKMRDEKVDGIVLDLRNNPGGLLIEAVLMTGLFIESGPVVLVKERRAISILPDTDPTIAYTGPLIVLVNRASASASEILAAALQDYGRAVIIGDSKTHGKGSVQSVLSLGRKDNNMGAIRVTSALYYRITGGSTQLKGVEPDIIIPSAFDIKDFGEDSTPNPLEWSTVRPVMFSPYADLSVEIPELRARSEARRTADERFQAYRTLLDRINTMNNDAEISLNFETRKQQAQTEKELLDVQNQMFDQTLTDQNATSDLIEQEAFQVMNDLILDQNPHPATPGTPGVNEPSEVSPDWESAQSTP